MSEPYEPRPHQRRALRALADTYQTTDRAQLHWFCGTGKTLVGRWLAVELQARTAVVFVPSLALIAQTIAEWQRATGEPFTALAVCSDRTAADDWRVDPEWWTGHGARVTTDAGVTAGFLRSACDQPRVLFSTYHSAPVVAQATRIARVGFDLMVCDEAHRLAGDPDQRFTTVLRDHEIPARRRLFLTATPVDGSGYRMSDVALFGPVADRQDLASSVAAGLIVDYRVLVLAELGAPDGNGTLAPATLLAAGKYGLRRIISFHGRVADARRFASDVDGLVLPGEQEVRASVIAGADPAARRRTTLGDLARGHDGGLRVVSNARCLAEGVDVPAVDGVLFAHPKAGIGVAQALGRALRPSPGKTLGYVILPIVGEDPDERFAGTLEALRALRRLDPRIEAEIETLRSWRPGEPRRVTSNGEAVLRFDLDGVDLQTLTAKLLDLSDEGGGDPRWDRMAGLLRDWAAEHGHTAVPFATVVDGEPLGHWTSYQRQSYAYGTMSASRAAVLRRIVGWAWTLAGAWWLLDLAAVACLARNGRLNLDDPEIADTRLTHRRSRKHAMTVGRWCARQRRDHRTGDLLPWQVEACEAIPGWSWMAGVPAYELSLVDALAEWVEQHGDANVTHEVVWGRLPLGAFVTALRRREVVGRLSAALREDVAVVTPKVQAPGALQWLRDETRWELHLLALTQYARRTGGCNIPEHGTEVLDGHEFPIYWWSTRQRHLRRHGNLSAERAALLELVPGWSWERERPGRVRADIGARRHGTRLGYAAGCHCAGCTTANTDYEAERQRRKAAGEPSCSLVDAGPARGHLRMLEGQFRTSARLAMQRVTGLNKKTIDEVINGTRSRVRVEVDEVLRAVTLEQLREDLDQHQSGRDPVPAGPTLRLITDLVSRGFPKAWINRELGGQGRSLQVGKNSDQIRRESAQAVARLHAAVGDLVPPPRSKTTRGGEAIPSLAELRVNQETEVAS